VRQLGRYWKDDRTRGMLELIATSDSFGSAAHALRTLEYFWGFSLQDMQTSDFWRERGVADDAVERVRDTVRRAGGAAVIMKWGLCRATSCNQALPSPLRQ
jgi:hypothetical protein